MTRTESLRRTLAVRWLTPLEAAQVCGVFSLSQRVGDFRRQGIEVMDRWVKLPSGARVKSYKIAVR